MRWESKTLSELNTNELFEYLKLRQQVFVVEQSCAYPDIDHKDKLAQHLLAWQGDELVACSRILPAGVSYQHPSIGRIATSINHRGTGLGRQLVSRSIDIAHSLYPGQKIEIGAQQHLENFYNSFGFKTISESYIEDGIPHIDMQLE